LAISRYNGSHDEQGDDMSNEEAVILWLVMGLVFSMIGTWITGRA
jgi:hypothetical protein